MRVLSESYSRHQREEQSLAMQDDVPWCYKAPNSIGNWHHERMLLSIKSILDYYPDSTWMTVGDGRFGSDANFLKRHTVSATATSISASALKIAKSRGWIEDYSEENAERISFSNDSFDFVLCKEAYHHLPRPALGFYEMLRVAKIAIVLIEPMDDNGSVGRIVKRTIKRLLRRDHSYDLFEPSGNFVYRMSVREVSKMLTALGLRTLAWKGMNTFWYAPFDTAEAGKLSLAWLACRFGVKVQDTACRLGLLTYGLSTIICFKSEPKPELLRNLSSKGFRVCTLPANPYSGLPPLRDARI